MKRNQIITIEVFILTGVLAWSFQKLIAKTNEVSSSSHLYITNQIIRPILTNDIATDVGGREQRAKYEALFRTPINFHGKVVDEKNNPILDAEVEYSLGDRPLETTKYKGRSDRDGKFSLTGVIGYGLSISVSKEGYYEIKESNQTIIYGGAPAEMLPTPERPTILILRRKGEDQKIIYAKNRIRFPKDGTPVEVNLNKEFNRGVASNQGNFIIECWFNDKIRDEYRRYDWRCRLTVPEGGFIERRNKFDFIAPEKNYQPYYEINMPATSEGWRPTSGEKEFFLKLKDENYARIKVEIITGSQTAVIQTYINPTGSRNLEFISDTIIDNSSSP